MMSLFLPLNVLEADILETNKSTLFTARHLTAKHPLLGIRNNMFKNSMTMFMSEVLYRAIKDGCNEEGLYEWCEKNIGTVHKFQGKEAIITIAVMENGTDNITVTTFAVNGDVNMTPLPDSQNKTINGKDGIFLEKNGRALFVYKVGEQIVNIDAPNEQLIEKVVV